MRKCGYNSKIYYYIATDEDGKITSRTILDGLKWTQCKGIKRVNLSISSKFYNSDLSNWIKENKNIKIYASYSNLKNSKDYPAMYKNAEGSGYLNDIPYKDNDIIYNSNRILVWNKRIHYYMGTSFLSVYSLVSDGE